MGNLPRGPTEGLYMGYPYAEPGLEQEREYTIPRPEPSSIGPMHPGRGAPAARITTEPLQAVLAPAPATAPAPASAPAPAPATASAPASGSAHEPSTTDRSLMILADSRRQALVRAEVAELRTQVLERRELKLATVVGALLLLVGAATVAALDFGLRSGRLEREAGGLRDQLSTVQGQMFEARTQVSEAGFALRGAELDHRERLARMDVALASERERLEQVDVALASERERLEQMDAALASERERRMRAEAAWAARVVQQLFLRR